MLRIMELKFLDGIVSGSLDWRTLFGSNISCLYSQAQMQNRRARFASRELR